MLAYVLAIASGAMIIISKFINHSAAARLGLYRGSTINFIVGSIVALLLVMLTGGRGLLPASLMTIPAHYYLAAVFGLAAMVISNYTLSKLPVLHSTSIVITTQMLMALLLDHLVFGQGSPLKVVGAILVIVALLIDQRIIKRA